MVDMAWIMDIMEVASWDMEAGRPVCQEEVIQEHQNSRLQVQSLSLLLIVIQILGGKSSSSGGGASHLKSLLRQDSGDKLNSRNDEKKKTDMLRMRMKEKEKQQRRVNQEKKDKSRNTNTTKMVGGAKKKK